MDSPRVALDILTDEIRVYGIAAIAKTESDEVQGLILKMLSKLGDVDMIINTNEVSDDLKTRLSLP